jgi:hypothetical protein
MRGSELGCEARANVSTISWVPTVVDAVAIAEREEPSQDITGKLSVSYSPAVSVIVSCSVLEPQKDVPSALPQL